MIDKNMSGYAFPAPYEFSKHVESMEQRKLISKAEAHQLLDGFLGITVQDYFAAKAMQGLIASGVGCAPEHISSIVESAYIIANAMLQERSK